MFIRWKRRKYTISFRRGETALTAQLVKSERVNGKPRQRILCYLGTISEKSKDAIASRTKFWKSAAQHLGALELEPAERARIETSLEKVVRKPTEEEWQAAMAARVKFRQIIRGLKSDV